MSAVGCGHNSPVQALIEEAGGEMEQYPDERISDTGEVEGDLTVNSPPDIGPRTVDAGAEGQPGGPAVGTPAGEDREAE